ncbi:MAG: HAMP domain-containing protein [Nitrospiraceae bacterium]|nr:MAG: HAMP domain-containing protein [Nitrospiraceae bacterium]
MKQVLFRNLTLQKKFIIITFSAVILVMVTVGALTITVERNILHRDIERQGRILAETLAIPVMNDLIYEKLGLVEEGGLIDNYVTEIFRRKDIDLIYLAVLDTNGRVISHNDFNEYGKTYTDSITDTALHSDVTIVQKFHHDKSGHDALDVATPLSIGKKRWGTLKFAVSLERLAREVQAVIFNGIIVTSILLAVGLVLIVLLSRRFIRPITEMAKTMEKAGGDSLDVRVEVQGEDELALLGKSFNRMIERIRESNKKLKQTHKELLSFVKAIERTSGDALDTQVEIEGCDEITLLCQSFNNMIERIRASNLELKKTHEKLFHSQRLASLGILASGVAHEINNPLGGMFNCVEMIEQNSNNEELRRRYLGLLNDGLKRIEAIVGKLLWMARREERMPQKIDIKSTLRDVYRFAEYRIKSKNILYREQVAEDTSLNMDPHDFHQVMMNLMINALQSMNDGGVLEVSAYLDDTGTILQVSDTGMGIDENDLHKIFDPFYTSKMPGEGTGLGLWVTYEIVNNYAGEITVESEKGKGSTFTLKFNGT